MPQGNADLVCRALELFAEREVERLLELLAPDVEFHPLGVTLAANGEPYLGHDGIRRFFSDLEASWDELRVTRREIRERGDLVVVVGRLYARGGGRVVDSPTGWLWRVRSGRIAWGRAFADPREALAQAGL